MTDRPAPATLISTMGASGHRSYTVACLCIGIGVAITSFWIASREWFYADDFAFLWQARNEFDALNVFVPLGTRVWPTYRPITIELFFSMLRRGFGVSPFPYLALSLSVHFATGFIVARIARQLRLSNSVALFVGVLSVAMYPSMQSLYWASAFQHVGAIFFYLLSISSFLHFLADGSNRAQLLSCTFLVLALMSNELSAALPGVLLILSISSQRDEVGVVARGLKILPQAAIVLAYAGFRLFVIERLPMHPAYALTVGWNVLENGASNLSYLLHESWPHALGLIVLVLWARWQASRSDPSKRASELNRSSLILACWMLVAALPTIAMPAILPRMAMILEAPMCLFIGVQLDACLIGRRQSKRIVELGLVGLLLLALPYGSFYERATQPEGEVNRQIAELLPRHFPSLPPRSCVSIRPHPDYPWDADAAFATRFRSHQLLGAIYNDGSLRLHYEDGSERQAKRCIARLQLEPGPKVTLAR